MSTEEPRGLAREIGKARSGPSDEYAEVLKRALVACAFEPRAGEYFDVLEIIVSAPRPVYNKAGLEYGAVGDHEAALSWLTRALSLPFVPEIRSG